MKIRAKCLCALAFTLAAGMAKGETPVMEEFQITSTPVDETTPVLGRDGRSDLIVYTMQAVDENGSPAGGDIWFQRLADDGAPIEWPVQVTGDATDDTLNDVSGDYIVYTAFDSVTSAAGKIWLYRISTAERWVLATLDDAWWPQINGNNIVWVKGPPGATEIMWYQIGGLGPAAEEPISIAGPVPPAQDVAVGEQYIVWAQKTAGQADVWAFDLTTLTRQPITASVLIDETMPATSGDWIAWQAVPKGAYESTIEAMNPKSPAAPTRLVASNGAWNLKPSVYGDLITWESTISGNLDIFVYRLSTEETFQVTTNPADQYLNDVFDNMVAYVDLRSGNQDIYVTRLFNSPPIAEAGPDQLLGALGSTVSLDGSQSYDPDGDPLTWQWTFLEKPAGSGAVIDAADPVHPTFVADVYGTYRVQLVVSDSWSSSEPDTVTIGFSNLPPVADAGLSRSVEVGATAVLDGSGSHDPNGDPLTYAWSLVSGPPGSTATIANATAVVAGLTPDREGTYVVQLVVNDGELSSDPSSIQIEAVMTPNAAVASVVALQAAVAALPDGVLKNDNMRNALNNKLNAVIAAIAAGDYASALQKLKNDILPKTDGCAASNPPAPDPNDWVRTCGEQAVLRPVVLDAIAAVTSLL